MRRHLCSSPLLSRRPARPRSQPLRVSPVAAPSARAGAPCVRSVGSRRSFSIASFRCAMMASVLDKSARAFAATARTSASLASAAMRAARSARIIACAAAMSEGSNSEACVTRRWNHIRQRPQAKTVSRPMSDAKSVVDGANQFRTEGNQVARPRSRSRRRQGSATKNDPVPIFSRTGMPLARHARSPSKDRLCVRESRRDDRSADHDGEPLGPAATGSRSLSSYPCGPSPAELSPKVGEGVNRGRRHIVGVFEPPLLHRRSDMPCPTIPLSN